MQTEEKSILSSDTKGYRCPLDPAVISWPADSPAHFGASVERQVGILPMLGQRSHGARKSERRSSRGLHIGILNA
jgi:hypothetical protein